jgi:hypothetical protein
MIPTTMIMDESLVITWRHISEDCDFNIYSSSLNMEAVGFSNTLVPLCEYTASHPRR